MENQGTGSTIGRGAESAKETARELAGTAKEAAQSRAQGVFQSGKQSAVERIEGVAQALRKASSELGDGNAVSQTAQSMADRIERFSRTLGERDFGDLLHEAEAYARREPALFLGGAFALGFALSRFLKASSERHSASSYQSASGAYGTGRLPSEAYEETPSLGGPSYI